MICPNCKIEMVTTGLKSQCPKCVYSFVDRPKKEKTERKDNHKMIREKIWKLLTDLSDENLESEYQNFLSSFMNNFHSYSYYNMFWLCIQKPDMTIVNSEKRWKDIGRTIKESERKNPLFVLAPRPWSKEVEDEKTKEKKLISRIYFNPVPVFDMNQTEGKELQFKSFRSFETDKDINDLYQELKEMIKKQVHVVKEIPMHPECGGSTDGTDIKINSLRPVESKLSTLLHEYSHIKCGHIGSDKTRQEKELEAELTAFMVGLSFGYPKGNLHYLKSWNKENSEIPDEVVKTAMKVSEEIRKVLKVKKAKELVA